MSRTARFGVYQIVPAKSRYGLAMKNGPKFRTVQKMLYRTGTVWYHASAFCLVQPGSDPVWPGSDPIRVRCRLNNIAIEKEGNSL